MVAWCRAERAILASEKLVAWRAWEAGRKAGGRAATGGPLRALEVWDSPGGCGLTPCTEWGDYPTSFICQTCGPHGRPLGPLASWLAQRPETLGDHASRQHGVGRRWGRGCNAPGACMKSWKAWQSGVRSLTACGLVLNTIRKEASDRLPAGGTVPGGSSVRALFVSFVRMGEQMGDPAVQRPYG